MGFGLFVQIKTRESEGIVYLTILVEMGIKKKVESSILKKSESSPQHQNNTYLCVHFLHTVRKLDCLEFAGGIITKNGCEMVANRFD